MQRTALTLVVSSNRKRASDFLVNRNYGASLRELKVQIFISAGQQVRTANFAGS